jgi:hypothetical protein
LLWLKQALQLLPSLSFVAASGQGEAQKRGRQEIK